MKVILLLLAAISLSCVTAQFSNDEIKANDLVMLNVALALERLEATFYSTFQARFTAANFTAAGYAAGVYDYLTLISQHENTHVTTLVNTITAAGGTPAPVCTYNFASVTSVATYIGLAQVLESVGAAAYSGGVNFFGIKNTTQTAATIATVEARHSAYLNTLAGVTPNNLFNTTNPFPYAYENNGNVFLPNASLVSIVSPFVVSCTNGAPAIPALPQLLVQVPISSAVSLPNGNFVANASTVANDITQNDNNALQYALFLEHLEASFYNQFLNTYASASFPNASVYQYISLIRDHENAHVSFLTAALSGRGATPITNCSSYNFTALGSLSSVAGWIAIARTLENAGVSAYDGAIAGITDKTLIQAAGTIALVEARHAAYLNLLVSQSPFPDAFDTPVAPSGIVGTIAAVISACSAAQQPPALPGVYQFVQAPNTPTRSPSPVPSTVVPTVAGASTIVPTGTVPTAVPTGAPTSSPSSNAVSLSAYSAVMVLLFLALLF